MDSSEIRITENEIKGEERNGFYVGSMMKRVWMVQLKILSFIDSVCRRHGLTYFADWGTMLGAVREKGYIAWDDDLDLGMFRKDFELFRHFVKMELPEGMVCANDREGDPRDLVFCIRNTVDINLQEDFLKDNYGCPYSVGVDIFVYDHLPDDEGERELQLSMFSYAFTAAKRIGPDQNYEQASREVQELIDETERLTGVHPDRSRPLKPQMFRLADQIAAMYYDTETKDLGIVGYTVLNEADFFPREWFRDMVRLPFEGIEIPVPRGYEEILKSRFGEDYMVPKRYSDHEYPYFRKQEEQLFQDFQSRNMEIPKGFRNE